MESQGIFHRLFSIYRGEGKKALLFSLLSFFTALSVVLGVTLSDGLFLEEVGGTGLPLVFLFTALGMLSGSTLYFYALHRFSISQIALGLCSLMLLFYGGLITLASGYWFWFALKSGCYIFLTVMWTALWTFIDQYYDLQDAKRLYGMFTAFLVTGCAAGSGLVYFLVARISLLGMLIVAASSVCGVALWIFLIARTQPVVQDDTLGDAAPRAEGRSILRVLRQIATSRFTLMLLLSSFLIEILTAVTEFSYMDRLSTIFITDHHLTLFLAKCRTFIYLGNVLFGLFFYGRSVKRFGTSTLVMLPTLYFSLLFAIWPVCDGVLPAVLGLVAVEGILYAIDDPNFNLLVNAVPTKIKARVRVLTESFFEPLGMLISALLLLFFQQEALFLGIGISLASVVVCIGLYRHYSPALFANLSVNSIHFEKRPEEWLGEGAQKSCLKALQSNDLGEVEVACNALLEIATVELLPYLLQAVERLSPSSRNLLLERIAGSEFAEEPLLIDHLERWIDQPTLCAAALFYLAKLGHLSPEVAESYLESEWLQERAAALITLQRIDLFEEMIESTNPEEVCLALSLIPYLRIEEPLKTLHPFLGHPSLLVERAAMKTLAKIATIGEAKVCISKLCSSGDSEIRAAALQAIKRIDDGSLARPLVEASAHFRPSERRIAEAILCAMGNRIVPTLLSLTRSRSLHDRCRLLAGRAMGRIGLPKLQLHLSDLLEVEIERAYFYFFHGATIQKEYPQYNLHLLEDALATSYHLVIDFIIQMLGLCSSVEQVELLSHSLRSQNEKIHSQAVETLADSCDRTIFRKLEPLIDDRPLHDKLAAYLEAGRERYCLQELLAKLEESSSPIDSIIAKSLRQDLQIQPKTERIVPQGSPLALELARA